MSVAIITGASGGIGREFARQMKNMLPEIDEYWLIARGEEKLTALRDELSLNAKIIPADLASPKGLCAVEDALRENKPKVKYLINAAGFGKFGGFDEISPSYAESMIDLNVKALVLLTYMIIPYIERGGRIIQLGSGSCFTPLPYFNVYSSSKVFVLHFTKALNFELKKYGIRATCFCPGWVETEFLGLSVSCEGATRVKKMKPLLKAEKVVRKCIRAAERGKTMCVVNWYTKMQHTLFKILPDAILTKLWLGMLEKPKSEDNSKEA